MSMFLVALITITTIIIDQTVKYYVQSQMLPGQSIPVIEGIFHITYILNPGAAFGVLENQTIFFVTVAFLMLGISIYFFSQIPQHYRLMRFGLSLMAGGAVGNVIDRVKAGVVVDFFDFRIWPVFNIADMAIVTGVSCIIYSIIFLIPRSELKEKNG
ncbi:MAG TPA: signal peptidase II [Methylomusa anaerophila]|uniref:Lipoprotein signal peptidase n=2 Tax=Methylomusa anaerophila TaxID=1930071 RepID=A0A348APL5_9FIRM|nr:signal peptidase II [Methylomusa anaerophila]BBB93013.1 lipoprotein signal peptidase [Methylomusa anaerophila]HML87154.1 signal peptidase II [Methylomusa anaerophila]